MNRHIKSILVLASILALLVSVRDAQYLHAAAPAGTSGAGLSPDAQIEPSPTPSPMPEGDAGDTGQATTVESSQAEQATPSPAEPVGDVDPESIPSLEERDAILDGVNLGPPILPGDDGQVGVGPAPGTESVMGHGEETPELPRSDGDAGEEPEPESDTEQRSSLVGFLIRLIETLHNWWQELLT